MPVFEYRALTPEGKGTTGVVDADTAKDARTKLRTQSYHVTEIKEVGARDTGESRIVRVPFLRRRAPAQKVSVLTRQLATLLKAGVPVADAFKAMIEQAENRRDSRMLRDLKEKVTEGLTVADAMQGHPYYFNDLYVNMIIAGESAGNLDDVLSRLADYWATQNRIRSKIFAALAYPIVLICFGALVVFVLVTFLLPRITNILEKQNIDLPLTTQILLRVTRIFGHYWWLFILGVIAVVVVWRLVLRSEQGRFAYDSLIVKLPILGDLFRKAAVSRFAVTLSSLLASGVPVLESLKITRNVIGNAPMARAIDKVHEKIMGGADISGPIKQSELFPPVVGYMIAVGEQSGQLETILDEISHSYDEEVEISAQKMASLVEPFIIIALAMIVGFIVYSVVRPILDFTSMGGAS